MQVSRISAIVWLIAGGLVALGCSGSGSTTAGLGSALSSGQAGHGGGKDGDKGSDESGKADDDKEADEAGSACKCGTGDQEKESADDDGIAGAGADDDKEADEIGTSASCTCPPPGGGSAGNSGSIPGLGIH